MFDFSFGEIFVIAVVAVIFLGPDKLPQTFVKIAKFLRAIKKTINDAKDTLDREIHISEMKQDALEYKKKFADSAEKLKNEILKDADVEGIKREIEGAKSAAILNESLEKRSISFDEVESKGKAVQERLKGNLKKKNAESALDSTDSQNLVKNNHARSAHLLKASSGEGEGVVREGEGSDFAIRKNPCIQAPPPPPKKNARGEKGDFNADLSAQGRKEKNNKENAESKRDSSPTAQNDKFRARVAESTKKSKKSTLDSANKKPKKSPRNTTKNRRTKQDGSN